MGRGLIDIAMPALTNKREMEGDYLSVSRLLGISAKCSLPLPPISPREVSAIGTGGGAATVGTKS